MVAIAGLPSYLALSAPAGDVSAIAVDRSERLTLHVNSTVIDAQPATVTVFVSGAGVDGAVRFFLDGAAVPFTSSRADANGSLVVTLRLPALTVGPHTLSAIGERNGYNVRVYTHTEAVIKDINGNPSHPANSTEFARHFDLSNPITTASDWRAVYGQLNDTNYPQFTSKIYSGLVHFNTTGVWRLGFDSDDSGELRVEGQIIGEGTVVAAFYGGRGLTDPNGYVNYGTYDVTQAGWYSYELRVQNTQGPGGGRLGYRSPAMFAANAAATLVPAAHLFMDASVTLDVQAAPPPAPEADNNGTIPPPITDDLPVNKWVFQAYDFSSLNSVDTYYFEVNPEEVEREFGGWVINAEPTTVSNGQVITWEGSPKPVLWKWSGRLLTRLDHDAMVAWGTTGQRIWLTDHFRRRFLIKVEDVSITRVRDRERPWHHKYEMSAWLLAGEGVSTR